MVDIFEMEKCQTTGLWKVEQHRLLVIAMPFHSARALFQQKGILATEEWFKTLHAELKGAIPAQIRAIALMHGFLYALADHDQEQHRRHPEPELFGWEEPHVDINNNNATGSHFAHVCGA